MLGNTSGLVKKEDPHLCNHYFSHRHALATKTLSTTLKKFFQQPLKSSTSSETSLSIIACLKHSVKKWEQNMKCFSTTTEVRWL
jgi:hypothetical protein